MSKTESSAEKVPKRASRAVPRLPVGEGASLEGINSFVQIMLWMSGDETLKGVCVDIKPGKRSEVSFREGLDALRARHQALENAIAKENYHDPYWLAYHHSSYWRDLLFGSVGDSRMVEAVKHGVPVKAVHLLIDHNVLSKSEIDFLVMPRRTLDHRKRRKEPLNEVESERLLRIARIIAIAEDTFANSEKAATWLRRPSRLFSGKTPMATADTEAGGRMVEDVLQRIAHGIAA